MSENVAQRFFSLFRGLDRAHGSTSVIGREAKKNKVEANSVTIHEPVTEELWQRHLDGDYGLGIIPITDDATVNWAAIDVDLYDLDLRALERKVRDLNLPLVTCCTKSGGAHLFLFVSEPITTQLARERLDTFASALSFSNVEIFPKQVKLGSGQDVGSWLNMPYQNAYGENGTDRYAILNGDPLRPEDFLDLAEASSVKPDFLKAIDPENDVPFSDGPPCLQQLTTYGIPEGGRNNALFNVAVYLKLKYGDEEYLDKLEEYNEAYMDPPLKKSEVRTVSQQLEKKSYRYTCSVHPISSVCNKPRCLTRRYGVGSSADEGGSDHDIQIGEIRKHLTEPPFFVIDIDDNQLELSTDELMDYSRFTKKCVEQLNRYPPPRKNDTWRQVVRDLLERCELVQPPPDASPEGKALDLLHEFCVQFAATDDETALLRGMPFTKDDITYFRSRDLEGHLERQGYREVRGQRLYKLLRDKDEEYGLGIRHHTFKIHGQTVQAWGIPAYEDMPTDLDVPRREEGGY